MVETSFTLKLITSVFLFFAILRLLKQFAAHFNSVAMKLDLFAKIMSFLGTYLITLVFIFSAWSLCQHILFGQQLEAYSTVVKSFLSTLMLALREFKFLNQMFVLKPNMSLLLFTCFVIFIIYFMANIFISLVIIVYNDIVKKWEKKMPSNDDILKQEHWSL
jgi:hypothetical protein